jgi:hypothetical protein
MRDDMSNLRMWRKRLAYTAMSLLVVWHTFAMVVGPAPDSDLTTAARVVLQPYLSFFRLDNQWGFFAPDVAVDAGFRYVIEDASGKRHFFNPAEKLSRYHPTDIWVKDWYIHIMEDPETYRDAVAASLCREQAALHPVKVMLLEIDQTDFMPADQLSGKHPFDPEFLDENILAIMRCPAK